MEPYRSRIPKGTLYEYCAPADKLTHMLLDSFSSKPPLLIIPREIRDLIHGHIHHLLDFACISRGMAHTVRSQLLMSF
jgi:hypothetical protein